MLIEYQNDFTSEGGVLHDAFSEVMGKTDMLTKTNWPTTSRDAEA